MVYTKIAVIFLFVVQMFCNYFSVYFGGG